jgi:hypothetical protein
MNITPYIPASNDRDDSGTTESIARFQSLQPGQYWRATVANKEENIDEGEVLLITSVRAVDDEAHTVILRMHPDKLVNKGRWDDDEHRFLLDDFLAAFAYEPDHQAIRARELGAVRSRVEALNKDLIDAQTNPAILANVVREALEADSALQLAISSPAKGSTEYLPVTAEDAAKLVQMARGTVAEALQTGLTEEAVQAMRGAADRQHQIASIKATWIQNKTTEIATTIQAMTPYYEEQAAAALAMTSDVREYVSKIKQGIESLDLYIGKDVVVNTIREGKSAPTSEPLTFVQKKLLMDEELAAWAEVDEGFDFQSRDDFFKALQENDALVQQIFPTERCVLVMATTRRHIDYGDTWANMMRNKENHVVFLLVRDGMNIHQVYSSVESHLGAARLFPTKNDQDKIFCGLDGSKIKFEDVHYTDKLQKHELFALHYKRFLLLACGLDHRLKLFGDFYDGPQTLDFVSLDFQNKHCRFLHDDDNAHLLPGTDRPRVMEWWSAKNEYLRSGSRVYCNWYDLMDPYTAPAAVKSDRGGDRMDRRYMPRERYGLATVYKDGDSLCVDVEVTGQVYSTGEKRTFNCKVNLSVFKKGSWSNSTMAYLCLDAVEPEELNWYIHNRAARLNHLDFIRTFKQALKHLQEVRAAELPTRAYLLGALQDGRVGHPDQHPALVSKAVSAWRSSSRGKTLPQPNDPAATAALRDLLNQMFLLAGHAGNQVNDVEQMASVLGYKPLRLIVSGASKLALYAAPALDEMDNRLQDHVWVHRITLETKRGKVSEKSRRWALLPENAASESTIYEWPEAAAWAGLKSHFESVEHKQRLMMVCSKWSATLAPYTKGMDQETWDQSNRIWSAMYDSINQKASMVDTPDFAVPVGMVYDPDYRTVSYLCVIHPVPHALLHSLAPGEKDQARIRQKFISWYANKESAAKQFAAGLGSADRWTLGVAALNLDEKSRRGLCSSRDGARNEQVTANTPSPLLQDKLSWWKSEKPNLKVWLSEDTGPGLGLEAVDSLLGLERPVDYEELTLAQYEVDLPKDAPLSKYRTFVDIMPTRQEAARDRKMLKTVSDQFGASGYSQRSSLEGSRAKARKRVALIASGYVKPRAQAVCSIDLPEAPQPPAGTERWYILKEEQAQP